MTTPLPTWTLEEVEDQLLILVKGSNAAMIRHLVDGLRRDLPDLTSRQILVELLSVIVGAAQSAKAASPSQNPGEVSLH